MRNGNQTEKDIDEITGTWQQMTSAVELDAWKRISRDDKESTYLRRARLCGDVNGGLFN